MTFPSFTNTPLIRARGDVAGKTFKVEVTGVDVVEKEEFSVTLFETPSLPALLDLSPSTATTTIPRGKQGQIFFTVSEYARFDALHDVVMSATDLSDGNGNQISSSSISFGSSNFDVDAGSNVSVPLTISIPIGITPGTYNGTIVGTAQNGEKDNSAIARAK